MKRPSLPFILLGCAALAGFTSGAAAQEISEARAFDVMDTDGDGAVSEAEYLAYHTDRLRQLFQEQDKDGDGFIQASEEGITLNLPTKFLPNIQFVRGGGSLSERKPTSGSRGATGPTSRRGGG